MSIFYPPISPMEPHMKQSPFAFRRACGSMKPSDNEETIEKKGGAALANEPRMFDIQVMAEPRGNSVDPQTVRDQIDLTGDDDIVGATTSQLTVKKTNGNHPDAEKICSIARTLQNKLRFPPISSIDTHRTESMGTPNAEMAAPNSDSLNSAQQLSNLSINTEKVSPRSDSINSEKQQLNDLTNEVVASSTEKVNAEQASPHRTSSLNLPGFNRTQRTQQPQTNQVVNMASPDSLSSGSELTSPRMAVGMLCDNDHTHTLFKRALNDMEVSTVRKKPKRTDTEEEIIDITEELSHVLPPSIAASKRSIEDRIIIAKRAGHRRRSLDVPDQDRWVERHYFRGVFFKHRMCVEFKDGSFMKIIRVKPERGGLRLAGWRLFRTTHEKCDSYLPPHHNELVWLTQMTDAMSTDDIKAIVGIQFTNFRTDMRENPPNLTCRLKFTIRQAGVIIRPNTAAITSDQYAIEYLEYSETDPGLGKWSNELRAEHRGETVPFGAADRSSRDLEINNATGLIDIDPERAYTLGDTFCGGGGVSCGAKQAGLRIKYANDVDEHALNTYHLNYVGVETEHSSFSEFITSDPEFLKVDIAHASPPCQTWSPAHTVNSANDDKNSACVFTGVDLVRVSKCRVLTLEETAGLVSRHMLYFNRVVLSLVQEGYAVRWSVLNCDKYGVPQDRKRVVIIAAGPGEALPHYAEPTHGIPGALPRETIASTINNIPAGAADHDPAKGLARWRFSHHEAFDENTLAKTITCGGGEFNYHPSGKRPYTSREMAALQTFPLDYHFAGRYTRKQIGNAVPPLFAKAMFGEVIRSLRETDRAEAKGVFR